MRSRLLSLGLVLALLAGGVGAYMLAGGEAKTYSITADVDQAPNLFKNGRVMVRGVEVGRIEEVVPRPDGVRLTLSISDDVKVPADAELAVIPITVISDRYVQLLPPYTTGDTLRDGDHIGVDRTSIPAELDEVLTQLHGLLAALEPKPGQEEGPLSKLITSLDEALSDRSDDLSGALSNSASVLGTLASSTTEIEGLISDLDIFFASLASRSSELGLLNERFAIVAEALQSDQANIEGTIENVAFLSDETASLLSDSGGKIARALKRLTPIVEAVLRHEGELRQGVRWTNVIAQSLGATDGSGRGLYAYSGRQAAPGSSGAEYNYRIDTRDTITCERLELLVETSLLVINPNADLDGLTGAALTFIAPNYQDDLAYLIKLLIPACADYPGEPAETVGLQALDRIANVTAAMTDEEIAAAVAQWLMDAPDQEELP